MIKFKKTKNNICTNVVKDMGSQALLHTTRVQIGILTLLEDKLIMLRPN